MLWLSCSDAVSARYCAAWLSFHTPWTDSTLPGWFAKCQTCFKEAIARRLQQMIRMAELVITRLMGCCCIADRTRGCRGCNLCGAVNVLT